MQITDEMVEVAARAVFEHWQFQSHRDNVGTPVTVAWRQGGNALKQDEARSYARAALEAVAPAIRAEGYRAGLEDAAKIASARTNKAAFTREQKVASDVAEEVAAAIRATAEKEPT